MLERLQKVKYVYYAGAPLKKVIGDKLAAHVKLVPAMGTTEAGGYFIKYRDDEDWDYITPRSSTGIEFEPRSDQLYELVFRRSKECERFQQIFAVYPGLDRFPTKDLWTKHPQKPGLWKYVGRTDDMIILSHGEDLHASKLEAVIQEQPEIRAALIGGDGRPKPFLILELTSSSELLTAQKTHKIEQLWPVVERANVLCSDYVKLTKGLTILADPAKPLVRTSKGTVMRQQSLALYKEEILALYSST